MLGGLSGGGLLLAQSLDRLLSCFYPLRLCHLLGDVGGEVWFGPLGAVQILHNHFRGGGSSQSITIDCRNIPLPTYFHNLEIYKVSIYYVYSTLKL